MPSILDKTTLYPLNSGSTVVTEYGTLIDTKQSPITHLKYAQCSFVAGLLKQAEQFKLMKSFDRYKNVTNDAWL